MSDFRFSMPEFKMPEIRVPNIDPIRNYQLADYQYEILGETIARFESNLDEETEVAIQLAAFGQSILMNVVDIGYSNPSLIHFYGFVNGQKAELVQHVSQLSFLLTAVPKMDQEQPARRIGFIANE
ncbi:hypothetical protein DFQ01_103221 [Paenibacillus cellulosilyticus]|uniref:Uncharacterized protein n=1 Tax=Paenibacillus cellulosilyticus TaxID=375489 RepID=A0A2V2Z144_9BACL|nr:DUF6173 family protein [Paenibacillus cellulosilyticus]PWW06319.1 hypothetical protein DFQ01_103221 [Paenibacillus cellulosilyticus]QKS43461.1 hypothetical protein HUB94_02765 [Paenibacillus cellulosilyticus]QKS46321.1 hypothetical protein HUB94_19125 [Paenibacillus cellulosilyticus]